MATRRMKRETVVGASWFSWSEPGFVVKRQTASYDSMITAQKGGWLLLRHRSERSNFNLPPCVTCACLFLLGPEMLMETCGFPGS